MPIEFNSQETDRFGIRSARVTDLNAEYALIERVAIQQDIRFLSVRVPTDDISKVQTLEAQGFCLMDTLVYYHRSLDSLPTSSDEAIRLSSPEDADRVANVARSSFRGYFGHYHADPRLNTSDADDVYIDWAKNSILTSGADTPATVMELDGKIVSFLTMRIKPKGLAELVLVGVSPEAQGKGVYGRLIDHGMGTLKGMGCKEVITSTQINNIPVQKAWGKRGFRMHSSFYTLHKWLDAPDH